MRLFCNRSYCFFSIKVASNFVFLGSASAKSSKNLESSKSRPKSLRTLSVPVNVPSVHPSGDGELFKVKSLLT